MRSTATGLVAGAVTSVALWVLTGPAALATEGSVVEVGWWSANPTAQPAGEGAFVLEHSVIGPLSTAAIRLDVGPSPLSVDLVLTEDTPAGAETAALLVCTTTDAWSPADPGASAEAPEPDCDRAVDLERSADGGSWSADILPALLGTGEQTVMIVPAAGDAPLPPTFRIPVSAVAVSAVPADTSPDGGGSGVDPGPGVDPFPAPPASGDFSVGPTPLAGPSPTFAAPPVPAPNPVSDAPDPAVDPDLVDAPRFEPAAAAGTHRPWSRLLAILPLSTLAGAGTALTNRWQRETGGLESVLARLPRARPAA